MPAKQKATTKRGIPRKAGKRKEKRLRYKARSVCIVCAKGFRSPHKRREHQKLQHGGAR